MSKQKQKTNGKQWFTKHYRENPRLGNTNPIENRGRNRVFLEGLAAPAPLMIPVVISC
jgi:hypothetical protein